MAEEGSPDLDLQPTPSLVARGVCTAKQVGMPSPAVGGRRRIPPLYLITSAARVRLCASRNAIYGMWAPQGAL